MKVGVQGSLERLVAGHNKPIGLAFFSFTFEPAFFEEQILRAVLSIGTDPTEQPLRFHEDMRRALQEAPVACIVDAGARSPGQRFPYDLLEVHRRVHHPKLTLVLFEESARLGVGSGNLTRGGFGDNSELLFIYDLDYEVPSDAEVLRAVDRFLTADLAMSHHRGTLMDAVLGLLRRKIANTERTEAVSLLFVDSFSGALLDEMFSLIPKDARVLRAGVLAPFLEQDDADAHDTLQVTSVLERIAGLPRAKDFVLDLATIWDQNSLERPSALPHSLEDAKGFLCVHRTKRGENVELSYSTLNTVASKTVEVIDSRGEKRRRSRDELEDAVTEGDFWPIASIVVNAPMNILNAIRRNVPLSLWLHPAWRIEGGKPVHRPLHAKLIAITFSRRGKACTLVYVGSANASRKALLQGVDGGGNIECGVVFRIDEAVTLADFSPELVSVATELVQCQDRIFAPTRRNFALCIESAIHDAAAQTLVITFVRNTPPIGAWSIEYDGEVISVGETIPGDPRVIQGFTLRGHCCELTLLCSGERFAIPITVADLAALPPSAALADLSLRELLALLGARVGRERLATIRAERGAGGMRSVLDAVFGEGFGPDDVFRAWEGIAQELADPLLSLAGFRARLEGAIGASALWKKIQEAISGDFAAAADELLSRDEGWFYGAELSRTLTALDLPEGREKEEKEQVLRVFLKALQRDLETLQPSDTGRAWIHRIREFYAMPVEETPS